LDKPIGNIDLSAFGHRRPWNKGKLVGQKVPLKLHDIWAIRVRLQIDRCKLAAVAGLR
jgi:hypothetical protein